MSLLVLTHTAKCMPGVGRFVAQLRACVTRQVRVVHHVHIALGAFHLCPALAQACGRTVLRSLQMACMLRLTAATEDYRDEAGNPRSWITSYASINNPNDPVSVYVFDAICCAVLRCAVLCCDLLCSCCGFDLCHKYFVLYYIAVM